MPLPGGSRITRSDTGQSTGARMTPQPSAVLGGQPASGQAGDLDHYIDQWPYALGGQHVRVVPVAMRVGRLPGGEMPGDIEDAPAGMADHQQERAAVRAGTEAHVCQAANQDLAGDPRRRSGPRGHTGNSGFQLRCMIGHHAIILQARHARFHAATSSPVRFDCLPCPALYW
jgi:hypothetical protein